MTPRRRDVIARMGLVLVVSVAGFTLGHRTVRRLETGTAIALIRPLSGRVFRPSATSIGVVPVSGRPFQAVVTPTCSSLSSVLAIVGLGSLCPPSRRRRVAVLAAAATVAAGNIARIAGSVAVGIAAGRGSLVLFHDWVGSVFAFAYTLGGYILLLSILLSRPSFDSYELELA
jgi:carbamoyl-phosphate synthase large subunit